MMSSFIDPVAQSKMPRHEGTALAGIPKPGSQYGYPNNPAVQYSGAYISYDPRGADFTSAWSRSKYAMLTGRGPVDHLASTEEPPRSHMVYSPDNNTYAAEASHTSPVPESPGRQSFRYYNRSPGHSGRSDAAVAQPLALRKPNVGETVSPPPDSSVCLAIPKPVYGHNPCCSELGCMLTPRYGMDRGPHSMPHTAYEDEWMYSAHYGHRALLQGRSPQPLMHHRPLPYAQNAERHPLKDMVIDDYPDSSPNRARTMSEFIEASYKGYPSASTRSPVEQSQRLQMPTGAYPGLPPSHHHHPPPRHERVTSVQHGIPTQVYQGSSPMPKYGQQRHQHMFYYPQASVELESGAGYDGAGRKHRDDVPTLYKHPPSDPRGNYLISQPMFSGTLSSPIAAPNPLFLKRFDHPSHAVYRMHVNAGQMRDPLMHPHHPSASLAGLRTGQPSASPLNLHVARPSASPSDVDMERRSTPSSNLYAGQPSAPPASPHPDRPLDFSQCRVPIAFPKPPQATAHSPGAFHAKSPAHLGNHNQTAVKYSDPLRLSGSPQVVHRNEQHASSSIPDTGKAGFKRSLTPLCDTSSPAKQIEENRDVLDACSSHKRLKMELDSFTLEGCYVPGSPPMPVIDTVFSLAPYKAYLQATGMLLPAKGPHRPESPEHGVLRPEMPSVDEAPKAEGRRPASCPAPKEEIPVANPGTPKKNPVAESVPSPRAIKVEKVEPQDCPVDSHGPHCEERPDDCIETTVKEEELETGSSDNSLMLVVKKCEPGEFESERKTLLAAEEDTSMDKKYQPPASDTRVDTLSHKNGLNQRCEQPTSPQLTSRIPPQLLDCKRSFQNIPPKCLILSMHKILLPNGLCSDPPQASEKTKPPTELQAEVKVTVGTPRPARQSFLDLHLSLCGLVSSRVSSSPEQELRDWLSQLDLSKPQSPITKAQKVSCLLGAKARELWLSVDMVIALQKVLHRLQEYIGQIHCPFPNVMRAGAVFVPMLVVKELLFPQVQGLFIDQVLQEHKVALRPTTLSEERILTQLHRKAYSSKLRRLLSLKHLPDIYADVLNLFYHACVCKRLGLDLEACVRTGPEESGEEVNGPRNSASPQSTAALASAAESPRRLTGRNLKSHIDSHKEINRKKSTSNGALFKESAMSQGDAVEVKQQVEKWCVVKAYEGEEEDWERGPVHCTEDGVAEQTEVEEPPLLTTPHREGPKDRVRKEPCNSWTRPLSSDELSLSPSDTESETRRVSAPPPVSKCSSIKAKGRSMSRSGVVLKLRRVLYSKGCKGREARYQAVSDPGSPASEAEDRGRCSARERASERGCATRVSAKFPPRLPRTGGFSHTLRPLTGSSQRRHKSLLKIKYCPYLAVCHSAEHRRRWVLRSAVQRARRALKFYYPDLVGERIRHLYEEEDGTEVWYRGTVMRVHESHPNPLKTVFEVRYDSEPEWQYYLELLIDYKKGWLKIDD